MKQDELSGIRCQLNVAQATTVARTMKSFLKGELLVYRGVEFRKDREKALHVYAYSEFKPEDVTTESTRAMINMAKQILADLSDMSPEFDEVAKRIPHEYYLLFNYGNGSIG